MLALVLSLQLLAPVPAHTSLDLVPPLRLELFGTSVSEASGPPPARLELEDPYAGSLHLGEVAAGFAGVVLADVASGIAGGTAALIVGVGMLASDVDGLAALAGGLVAAAIVGPLVNLALTPVGAVLGARLVDLKHPLAEQRGIGTPLLFAYAAKLVEALFFVGGAVLLGMEVPFAEVALVPFIALHYVGVPAAAAYGMHAQRTDRGAPAVEPALPPTVAPPTLQNDGIPPPPPPPPPMGRRIVVPLIVASF